jgi:hypothetical protein
MGYQMTLNPKPIQAISATISIFIAVMIFQGFNSIINAYFLGEEPSHFRKICINFIQQLIW